MLVNQEVCYSHPGIIKEVFDLTSEAASIVTDTSRLENDILNDIGSYLMKDPNNYKKRRYIRRIINSKISVAKRRNKLEQATSLSDESFEDDEGQAVEYEPEDVLADINSGNLEVKETIALLAQNDRRRNLILNAWTKGYTDDRELSSILADTLGGNSESHRKFIHRFRNSCRTQLYAQAI